MIESGEPYILWFAFIARFDRAFFDLSIYLSGLFVLMIRIFEDAISILSIPVISSHSINPILVAFELSVIPLSSINKPTVSKNNFLKIKSPIVPKKTVDIIPIILIN